MPTRHSPPVTIREDILKVLGEVGNHARIRHMADFVGVTSGAVQNWLNGNPPYGFKLNRLRFYLAECGQRQQELDLLHPVVRYVARLLAFRIIDTVDACLLLVITDPDHLSRILRGKTIPNVAQNPNTSATLMGTLERDYGSQLADREKEFQDSLELTNTTFPPLGQVKPEPTKPADEPVAQRSPVVMQAAQEPRLPTSLLPPRPQSARSSSPGTHPEVERLVVKAVVEHLRPAIPLILALGGNEYSSEAHDSLRQQLGGDQTFFNLTTALNRMCGWRMREQPVETGEWRLQ